MANRKHRVIAYRRKREQKTNYKKRLKLIESRRIRLVVRIQSRNVVGQFIKYAPDGDKVLAHINSKELRKFGWDYSLNSIPACYLTGLILAKKSKVKDAILDVGLQHTLAGSRIYAFVKGVVDGKVNVPINETVFPAEERLNGSHIKKFAENKKQTSKTKVDFKKITEEFDKVKKKILG
jgi:large subunit ribosomal protein L18